MSPTAVQFAQQGDRALARHGRRKAHAALEAARQARWRGREEAMVARHRAEALWWRRFAQHFARRARQQGVR